MMYQKEIERLQSVRHEQERLNKNRSHNEIKRDAFDPDSLGKLSPRVLAGPGPLPHSDLYALAGGAPKAR
jgi:hypothetical protein